VPAEGCTGRGGGHEMNARLEPRAIGRSNHSASAPLLAQQWMRDRDYFTLQTKASGAWLQIGWRRRRSRTASAVSPRTLPPAGLSPLVLAVFERAHEL
jgi:hypothetical protein